MHKTANVLDKLPKSMPGKAKQALHDIYRAAGRQEAEKVYGRFKDLYEKKFPRAVACLEKDREEIERLTRCKHPFRYTLFSTLASIRRSKCSSTWTGLSPPVMSTPSSMLTVKAPESAAWRVEATAPEVSTETRRNPLIASGLCEIGFVWLFFLSLVERDAGLRGLPLQNSERVKCLRWAVNDSLRLGPGTRVPPSPSWFPFLPTQPEKAAGLCEPCASRYQSLVRGIRVHVIQRFVILPTIPQDTIVKPAPPNDGLSPCLCKRSNTQVVVIKYRGSAWYPYF